MESQSLHHITPVSWELLITFGKLELDISWVFLYETPRFNISTMHRHTEELVPVRVLETLPVDILRRTRGLPSKVKYNSEWHSLTVIACLFHCLSDFWASENTVNSLCTMSLSWTHYYLHMLPSDEYCSNSNHWCYCYFHVCPQRWGSDHLALVCELAFVDGQ